MAFGSVMVSNNVLTRAFADGVDVSAMKLQKVLYFTASEYAKATGTPLLDERFEPWRYGPVLPSVHEKFSTGGGDAIRVYGKDATGTALQVAEDAHPHLGDALDRVWRRTGSMSALQLARLTHLPGSAWSESTRRGARHLSDADVMADTSYRSALDL